MKELDEEIKLTINTMQCDIDDGAHGELQSHLHSLLEIKRNELHQRLVERSWSEPVTHDEAKPLTTEELKAGGWWFDEIGSQSLQEMFREYGVNITGVSKSWFNASGDTACVISSSDYGRDLSGFKQIHRIGNEFYWGEA